MATMTATAAAAIERINDAAAIVPLRATCGPVEHGPRVATQEAWVKAVADSYRHRLDASFSPGVSVHAEAVVRRAIRWGTCPRGYAEAAAAEKAGTTEILYPGWHTHARHAIAVLSYEPSTEGSDAAPAVGEAITWAEATRRKAAEFRAVGAELADAWAFALGLVLPALEAIEGKGHDAPSLEEHCNRWLTLADEARATASADLYRRLRP